ncbi:GNAT family N-acetyltransferase [Salinicola tamaricis]|uniref:GNAT family N-acetyltransferase n=1 Tax=Salinicola tamaricis TaxID=1771309 RepID=UPI000D09820C|nr:GNAT family N-acetyltransferase [Salinicola tamaricis]
MTAISSLPASPRLLSADDLASWARFEMLANDDAWSTTLLGSALSDDSLEVWGVFEAAELRAVAVVAYLPFDAELQSISVHPHARRRGLAVALLTWLLARERRGAGPSACCWRCGRRIRLRSGYTTSWALPRMAGGGVTTAVTTAAAKRRC